MSSSCATCRTRCIKERRPGCPPPTERHTTILEPPSKNHNRTNGSREHRAGEGWPTQARFWLEWGCSHVTACSPDKLNCPPGHAPPGLSAEVWVKLGDLLELQKEKSTLGD